MAVGAGVNVAVGSSVEVCEGVSVTGIGVWVGMGVASVQAVIATKSARNTAKTFFIISTLKLSLEVVWKQKRDGLLPSLYTCFESVKVKKAVYFLAQLLTS